MENYEVCKERSLGFGNCSQGIFVAKRKSDGVEVAIKACPKSDTRNAAVLKKEYDFLSQVHHPHIISVSALVDNTADAETWLVMELAKHGDLMHYAQSNRLNERQVASIVNQVLQAVDYIHGVSFAHRDIKPHNILVVKDKPLQVKLADFGFVKKLSMVFPRQNSAGDAAFMPQDVVEKMKDDQPIMKRDYEKFDIYSIGVSAYVLLSGQLPFDNTEERFNDPGAAFRGDLSERFPNVSKTGVAFTKLLMDPDPEARPNAGESLTHEWLNVLSLRADSSSTSTTPATSGELAQADTTPDSHLKAQQQYANNNSISAVSVPAESFTMGQQQQRTSDLSFELADLRAPSEMLARESTYSAALTMTRVRQRGAHASTDVQETRCRKYGENISSSSNEDDELSP